MQVPSHTHVCVCVYSNTTVCTEHTLRLSSDTQPHKLAMNGASDAPGGGRQTSQLWSKEQKEGEVERCEVKEWSEGAWKPSQTGKRTHSLMK